MQLSREGGYGCHPSLVVIGGWSLHSPHLERRVKCVHSACCWCLRFGHALVALRFPCGLRLIRRNGVPAPALTGSEPKVGCTGYLYPVRAWTSFRSKAILGRSSAHSSIFLPSVRELCLRELYRWASAHSTKRRQLKLGLRRHWSG